MFAWVLELFFRRFFSTSNPERKWINPGFCTGPYLPIYGSGLCVLYLLASLGDRWSAGELRAREAAALCAHGPEHDGYRISRGSRAAEMGEAAPVGLQRLPRERPGADLPAGMSAVHKKVTGRRLPVLFKRTGRRLFYSMKRN